MISSLLNIDVDLSVSEETEAVSVALGQHLLLPCETGAVYPPALSTWRKDGVQVIGKGVGHHYIYASSIISGLIIIILMEY